jgi:hypothetical protein
MSEKTPGRRAPPSESGMGRSQEREQQGKGSIAGKKTRAAGRERVGEGDLRWVGHGQSTWDSAGLVGVWCG